jgi:predicted alpha/beta hydrolase family esterase
MAYFGKPVRVLVIPGLRGSGEAHWQTWLQAHFRRSRRVDQADWERPELEAWSTRIGELLASEPAGEWVAVAHSFGCLALAHHLGRPAAQGGVISAALMVAPAEPGKFDLEHLLPAGSLGVPGHVVASDTDPWMSAGSARRWADRWGLALTSLGDAGHINVEAGFGPLPIAKQLTQRLIHRVERGHRLTRASVSELRFAI